MKWFAKKPARWAAPLVLALGLLSTPVGVSRVHAQEPGAEGAEKSEGRPLDGYLATLCLVMFAFFIVGKSARR